MSNIKSIEKKWIDNFKKTPLVDKDRGVFIVNYSHQLFYGRQDESYSADFPEHFLNFYNSYENTDRDVVIDHLIEFLHFVGIKIRKESITTHLNTYPDDFSKLLKKSYYIFKALAHYHEELDINNPYYDNNGDLFFLLRIESGESIHGGQLNLFEDQELPDVYSKFKSFPEGYEKDTDVQQLFTRIESNNDCFFITGKAGTGKSTFIHYFALNTKKNVILMAFTGIAAINVGGQTIHSFFRFPLKPLLPEDHEIPTFQNYTQKYKIIAQVDTIIIDEVSMLRADILEAIDFSLRKNGGNPDKIFGGKQLLFIGDIFQIPPVVDSTDEVENFLFTDIFKSQYFFDSPSYRAIYPVYFEFLKSHRQKNDTEFVDLLDKVRICKVDEQTLTKLNERYNPAYIPRNEEFVMNLTSNNAIAYAENIKRLESLSYNQFSFEAEISGEFSEERFPTGKTLVLKKFAQVIFIKNDPARRWVNGTIGKVDFISDDLIEVRLADNSVHKLGKEIWENRKYKYDRSQRKIVSEIIGTFTQYPIKLAWAITIHKSQGLTFDNVIIDLGTGAFVTGQVYTALSRARTLKGITLKKKLRKEDIISDSRIINFYETEQLIKTL